MSTHTGTTITDLIATVDSCANPFAEFNEAVNKLRNQYREKEPLVLYHLIGYFRSNEDFRRAFIARVGEVCK